MSFPRVKIDVINENKLKSEVVKRRWRGYCQLFEYHVEDYNFGTLLRLDCREGYSESNTTLVPRVQFLAIEVARNRQGLNMSHFGSKPTSHTKEENNEENKSGVTEDNDKKGSCCEANPKSAPEVTKDNDKKGSCCEANPESAPEDDAANDTRGESA